MGDLLDSISTNQIEPLSISSIHGLTLFLLLLLESLAFLARPSSARLFVGVVMNIALFSCVLQVIVDRRHT